MNITIKFETNQTGISALGSQDGGKNWLLIELYPFKEYSRPNFGKRAFTYCSTSQQIEEIKKGMLDNHERAMTKLDESQRFTLTFA